MFRCPKRSRQLNSFRRLGRIWSTTPCLRRIISFNWPFLFSIVCVWTAGSVGSTKWSPWFTARCRKRLSRCNLRYDRHSSVITFEPNLTWRKMIGISVAALRLRTIRKYDKPYPRSTMANIHFGRLRTLLPLRPCLLFRKVSSASTVNPPPPNRMGSKIADANLTELLVAINDVTMCNFCFKFSVFERQIHAP